MKVLKNNYNLDVPEKELFDDTYPKYHVCDWCESEFEYDKSDTHIGALGAVFVDCPCCEYENMVEDEDGITLTKNNVQFPTHFFHTSKEEGAVDCCDNTHVKDYINQAIDFFRKNKDECVYNTGTGNIDIVVYRFDGDECYYVTVTNNYYSTYIPFEKCDY